MVANGGLYTNVMEKLRFEPNIDESRITVAIKGDGIVVLGGKVKSYSEKRLAEGAVEKIESVKGVANELEVDFLTSYKRDDADIVKAALNTLKWTYFVPDEQIKVAVEEGHVTLTGDVEYNYQKERAQSAVQDLYGVTFVTNNIKVKPSVTPFEVKEKIIKEFERNARIDASNIQIEVDGGKVTLKGSVKNFDEDKEARTAAWSVPGVGSVVDQLKISW
jgi:osmotically-inducible protein OsmY